MAELTPLQKSLIAVRAELEAQRKNLGEREWTTFCDIVSRYCQRELGEDE